MPSSFAFTGAGFSLDSAAALTTALVRVLYTSVPKASTPSGTDDALNPNNYTFLGPNTVTPVSVSQDGANPLAFDVVLDGAMQTGTWTVTVSSAIRDTFNVLISSPTTVTFVVSVANVQGPLTGGDEVLDPEPIIRKHLSRALVGPNWDGLIAALETGDQINRDNAEAAFNQLFVSSASGPYLEQRAADQGITKPENVGMSDDLFRQLVIKYSTGKVVQEAIREILEVFYGRDALRASVETGLDGPYNLSGNIFDLHWTVNELKSYSYTFQNSDFAIPGAATPTEVAVALTRVMERNDPPFAVDATPSGSNESALPPSSGGVIPLLPAMGLSPGDMSFTAVQGAGNPASQVESITNLNTGTLNPISTSITYHSGSGWLGAVTGGAGNAQSVTVQPVTGALTAATYTATVSVLCSNAVVSPKTFDVTFNITSSPTLLLSPGNLSFSATEGSSDPAPQTESVTNSSTGTLNTISTSIVYHVGSGWLNLTSGGSGNAQSVSNAPVTGALTAGVYTATVSVLCSNAINTPQTYDVTFTVNSSFSFPAPVLIYQVGGIDLNTWSKSGVASMPQNQTDYLGNPNSAWLMTPTSATSGVEIDIGGSGADLTIQRFGVCAKYTTVKYLNLMIKSFSGNIQAIFDTSTGTLDHTLGAATGTTITSLGSGWHYYEVQWANGGNNAFQISLCLGDTPSSAELFGSWTHGPSDTIALGPVTCPLRGTGQGTIPPVNISMDATEAGDASTWSLVNVTAVKNVADYLGNPNSACTVTATGGTVEHKESLGTNFSPTTVYWGGAFKAGTWGFVGMWTNLNNTDYVRFDLNAGTFVSSGNSLGTMTSLGGGWYWCSMTKGSVAGDNAQFKMASTLAGAIPLATEAAGGTIFAGPFAGC